MENTPMAINTIIGYLGDIVSEILSELTDLVTAITSNPLILMFVIFGFIGTVIGVFKRIIN